MVGLPARGKTFVARKVARYLTWLGHHTRLFNAGDYRRAMLGSMHNHEFFDPNNAEGKMARLAVAQAALDDLFAWLRKDGEVGIYDATNTTRARRDLVIARCIEENVQPLFLEIICDEDSVIEANIRGTKLFSPDYANVAPEEAVRDFHARISHYQSTYEPIGPDDTSYIKYIDKGRQLVINRAGGDIAQSIVRLLMNLRGVRKSVWLTRHGESVYNGLGLLGGDPELSPKGLAFAKRLSRFVKIQGETMRDAVVWTSTLKRTVQTVNELGVEVVTFRELDEINAGLCEAKSYSEIEREMPDEFAARKADKYRYRYPRGESYQDLIRRLQPVVLAFEREARPLLVVGHQAVLRAFYAYLAATPPEQCPHLSIPLHTVIELKPKIYDMAERRIPLD